VEYESDYRRQYCQDRVARLQAEYRRAEALPRSNSESRLRVAVAQLRSVVQRIRRRAPERAPAYRS
jgi:hypothetical protein